MLAASASEVDLVRLLLKKGADAHATDLSGDTALHLTVQGVDGVEDREEVEATVNVLGLLLDHGSNPARKGRRGETALHVGARIKPEATSKAVLEALLEASSVRDSSGELDMLDGAGNTPAQV